MRKPLILWLLLCVAACGGGEEKRDRPAPLVTLVGALAAYYRQIPMSHVEAGLRSNNIRQPWPEEVNRKIIGSIADQHFAPTAVSAAALAAEAVSPESIFVTGNTVIDALHWVTDRIAQNPALGANLAPY